VVPTDDVAHRTAHPHAHHHTDQGSLFGGHHHGHGSGSSYGASLGLVAATYGAALYAGDYRGVIAGLRWSRGRFGAAISLPAYRLAKNGKATSGIGDVTFHGHATAVTAGPLAAGVMAMASAPTGDGDAGLGMGHVMFMGEAWGTWTPGSFAVSGSAGFAHALGGASAHAEHGGGMWPLVDPMNASELTYGGTAMVALASTLGVGLRAAGAVPVGDGAHWLTGGVRVMWSEGRVATSAEVLGGLVGDPFGLRGVIETSVRFP
jgi:hypothetical protein